MSDDYGRRFAAIPAGTPFGLFDALASLIIAAVPGCYVETSDAAIHLCLPPGMSPLDAAARFRAVAEIVDVDRAREL